MTAICNDRGMVIQVTFDADDPLADLVALEMLDVAVKMGAVEEDELVWVDKGLVLEVRVGARVRYETVKEMFGGVECQLA